MTLNAVVRALRPRHWVKNVVVGAAALFALELDPAAWGRVAGAFAAFSAAASAFYLVNDVVDAPADRQHPVKRHRPIASGTVAVPTALTLALVLLTASLVGGFWIATGLAASLGAYAFLQVGYNLGLKRQPILDVMTLAGGFVLRAVGGAAAAGVPVSGWFVLCVGLLAFFLGLEKRKAELRRVNAAGDDAATVRAVMAFYTLPWLERMEGVVTSSALMAYALWTLEGARTTWMLATVPFVAYAIFRYQYLADRGGGETPEDTLVRDVPMVATVLLWAVTVLGILLWTQ